MDEQKRRLWKWLIVTLVLLAIIGFFIYRMLFPGGPVLDEVPNPIRDRASKNWTELEAQVPQSEFRNLYWGDMHVHTSFSFDAYIGGILPKPDDAYRFAKGEPIKVFTDDVRIERPLDFAAVTDHAEYLGELYTVHTPGAPGHGALLPRYFRSIGMDTVKQLKLFRRLLNNMGDRVERNHLGFFQGFETTKEAWNIELQAAEDHYEPGTFTTFAAYEWTLGINNAHAHRNVFFKNMMVPDYPVSALEAEDEITFWNSLERFRKDGATVMAVPHNLNLSEGGTFPLKDAQGQEFDDAYMNLRKRNEPLAEVHQAKGNSEVHPALWQEDEFADFEVYTDGGLDENNYIRHILKRGLRYKEETGVNPFQYGFIGSTDTHNGTPGNTEEDDTFKGNHAFVDYNAELRSKRPWVLNPDLKTRDIVNPGGLMGVWAKANTRSQIYEAMERKETYATSGTRIQVRFFGGYDLPEYSSYDQMLENGYRLGVHMGEALQSADTSPDFYIWVAKDPESARLDRVQIVKGWYEDGDMKEKIFNVLLSDPERRNVDGSVQPIDNGLDMNTAKWLEEVGATELAGKWTDPEYVRDQEAFYYVRALEVPTPRWSLYDRVEEGVKFPEDTPMVIQERAWSSPIWIEKGD